MRRIPLLDQPVIVGQNLVAAHARNAECAYRDEHHLRGKLETESPQNILCGKLERRELHGDDAKHGQQREQADQHQGKFLDRSIPAVLDNDRYGYAGYKTPDHHRYLRKNEDQYERRAADDAADLHRLEHHQGKPGPDCPTGFPETRTRQSVQRLHRGLAGIDCVLAEFHLNSDLHKAADEDDPERYESGFRPQSRSGDQFPGADNGRRQDESRSKITKPPGEGGRRFFYLVRREPVRIDFRGCLGILVARHTGQYTLCRAINGVGSIPLIRFLLRFPSSLPPR